MRKSRTPEIAVHFPESGHRVLRAILQQYILEDGGRAAPCGSSPQFVEIGDASDYTGIREICKHAINAEPEEFEIFLRGVAFVVAGEVLLLAAEGEDVHKQARRVGVRHQARRLLLVDSGVEPT